MLDTLDVAIGFATVMLAVSLIIMSLTQALASLLALRGARLRQGLEALITQAVPELAASAKALSTKILEHPLVSDSAVSSTGRWGWATAIKREELIPVLKAVLAESRMAALTEDQQGRIEQWFESFMARVSQWFVMNTRWITVGFAVVLAFSLHLNSVAILKQIQSDSETRAKLSAMSASLLDQTPEELKVVEAAYLEALKQIVRASADQFNDVDSVDQATITIPANAHAWLSEHAKKPEDVEALFTQFQNAAAPRLATVLDKSIDRAKTLQGQLASVGIGLVPEGHRFSDGLDPRLPEFWGTVVSVLFLALGAPFWFNVLKNMTSLRSIVAQKDTAGDAGGAATGTRGFGPPEANRLPDLPVVGKAT